MPGMITPPGRLAFTHLFKAWGGNRGDQDPKFMSCLILDERAQKSPEFAAIKKAVVEVAKKKFGDDVDMNSIRLPFKRGTEYQKYTGFSDSDVVINPRSNEKPGVIDTAGQDILDPNDVYAGCWGRMTVSPYAYSNSGNKGVSLGLEHVQKLKDGERLDGRVSAQAAFGDALPEGFETALDKEDEEIPF